ncbi:25114_t:CDS:2 [Gigaspora margarita]|uniref:25114_t:CDS:1 n=1 Tax=Gigaspora margarita TaxID=4874 RepID=A0ABN7UH27_GIGMA|nr:25114_t:CDS:2 [Gigaspora margarita]
MTKSTAHDTNNEINTDDTNNNLPTKRQDETRPTKEGITISDPKKIPKEREKLV